MINFNQDKLCSINKLNKKNYLVALNKAANILKNDGLVAFPTETVYGLGANALSECAIEKVFKAKGRPSDNPLIVHIGNKEQLAMIVKDINSIPENALKLINKFFPGALTIVLPKSDIIPENTSGGLDTVAIRMPANKIALDLINTCGFPLAAPSANKSTKPSPTRAEHVLEDFSDLNNINNNLLGLILDGGACTLGIESTVVEVTENKTIILRPGSITKEMLEEVVECVEIDKGILNNIENNIELEKKAKSPGVKYKHYAPKGDVYILKCNDLLNQKLNIIKYIIKFLDLDNNNINLNLKSTKFLITEELLKELLKELNLKELNLKELNNFNNNNFDLKDMFFIMGSELNLDSIASNIFDLLRECDRLNITKIYIQAIDENGVGLAIMNRLNKASGYKVIKL